MVLFCAKSYSQLRINEYCPINSELEDESGDNEPWLELVNSAETAISTSGYFLSNHPDFQSAWELPSFQVPAHAVFLVFLSGKTNSPNELHSAFEVESRDETIYLFHAGEGILDQVSGKSLQPNHSIARIPGEFGPFRIVETPSPNQANHNTRYFKAYCEAVRTSRMGGFYPNGVKLHLLPTSRPYRSVYTRNGSKPLLNGTIFPDELEVNTNTSFRIRNFPMSETDSLLPSEEWVETYWVETHPPLTVISLTTDSAYFFSPDSGIFITGPNASPDYPYYGANFWQDWKVPLHLEFFESNGRKRLDQWVDAEIHGGSQNRTKPMKSLHLEAKTAYGNNRMVCRFFPDLSAVRFKSLVLRNGSGDFNKLHCRDEAVHSLLIKAKMDLDLNPYRATKVYFNGQFLGLYNLREKIDKHFLNEHYPEIDKENLDLLEEDQLAWEGDFENWNQLFAFIQNQDLAQSWVFDSVSKQLDISNFIDYFIAETFFSNIDWPNNNMKYWRERKPGAKWRYLPIDFDISLGNIGWAPANYNMFKRMFEYIGLSNKQIFILNELLKNQGFRNRFINRYADAMNAWFKVENLLSHTQACLNTIRTEMPLQFQTWGGSMQSWQAEFDTMAFPYIQQRTDFAREHLRDYFQLQQPYPLQLDCVPELGGTFDLNSLQGLEHGWNGLYFQEVPITIKAVAKPGFQFLSFRVQNDSSGTFYTDSIQLQSNTQLKVQAIFRPLDEKVKLFIYPNPIANGYIHAVWEHEPEDSEWVEVYNSVGQRQSAHIYQAEIGFNEVSFNVSNWPSGIYTIRCGGVSGKFCKVSP
ncbi:MAG: CotH kinase family protein [Bacteroidia bacterium]|nr:CotH kinase family protein [Bacteroidia bacterium]